MKHSYNLAFSFRYIGKVILGWSCRKSTQFMRLLRILIILYVDRQKYFFVFFEYLWKYPIMQKLSLQCFKIVNIAILIKYSSFDSMKYMHKSNPMLSALSRLMRGRRYLMYNCLHWLEISSTAISSVLKV